MKNVYYITFSEKESCPKPCSVRIMQEQLHVETNQSKIYREVNLSPFSAILQRVCVAFKTNLPVQSSAAFSRNNTHRQDVELGCCPVPWGPPPTLLGAHPSWWWARRSSWSWTSVIESQGQHWAWIPVCFILSSFPRVSCLHIHPGWPSPWLTEHRAHFSLSPQPVRAVMS